MADDCSPAKWSDITMVEDEGLRTVECLRGRLLAERAASKAANDESEEISIKVIELEKQLKMEIKSRNRAEKRLKFLMKKLESLNISYVSADDASSFSEISEISSVSSSRSQHQMELQKPQSSKRQNCPSHEDHLGSLDEVISGNLKENDGAEDGLKKEDSKRSKSNSSQNDNHNEEHNQDTYHNVDNSLALVVVEKEVNVAPRNGENQEENNNTSMAIVVVESMVEEENQDVPISNDNVKEALDALKHARESIQTSMDMRRHMESNITQARVDSISC